MQLPLKRSISLRAFTLLESLIAIALLAVAVAIVAPAVIDRLDERAFEAAADGANEQLLMARAHAQATGEAVQVTWSPATGHVEARVYAPWESAGIVDDPSEIPPFLAGMQSSINAAPQRSFPSRVGVTDSPKVPPSVSGMSRPPVLAIQNAAGHASAASDVLSVGRRIDEPWASRPLGKGIRIATQPPASFAGPPMRGEPSMPSESQDREFRSSGLQSTFVQPEFNQHNSSVNSDRTSSSGGAGFSDANMTEVRLAVFMPDGSAMVGEQLWLDDGRGRLGVISINAFSGLPAFQRIGDHVASSQVMSGQRESDPRIRQRRDSQLDSTSRPGLGAWDDPWDSMDASLDGFEVDDEEDDERR